MLDLDTHIVVFARLQHYVVWYSGFWGAATDCPIENRNDPASYWLDKRAEYFRIYSRLEVEHEIDGKTIIIPTKPFGYSPMYVPDGRFANDRERVMAYAKGGRLYAKRNRKVKDQVIMTRYGPAALPKDIEVVFYSTRP